MVAIEALMSDWPVPTACHYAGDGRDWGGDATSPRRRTARDGALHGCRHRRDLRPGCKVQVRDRVGGV